MSKMINDKLIALREFQEKHPTAHVGGSIGLMIRGIDLKRDLNKSDLDITVDEFIFNADVSEYEERSDNNDFDCCLKKNISNSIYVKLDIRVCPEPQFEVVNYNGIDYNVSKLRDILFWKKKYANKGVQKHIDDLITIETGIRPLVPVNNIDTLPF